MSPGAATRLAPHEEESRQLFVAPGAHTSVVSSTRAIDAGIYATIASFVLADVLPGPMLGGAVAVGIAGGFAAALHDNDVARRLLVVSLGMLLGVAGIYLLALAHR